MEDPSVALALQLQLEDLDAFAFRQAKHENPKCTDESVAFQAYRTEIEEIERRYLNREIARNLREQGQTRAASVHFVRDGKAPEPPDLGTSSNPVFIQDGAKSPPCIVVPDTDEEPVSEVAKGKRKRVEPPCDAEPPSKKVQVTPARPRRKLPWPKASTSKHAAEPERPIVKHHCTACTDSWHNFDIASAPCGHRYCRDCTVIMFKTAMKDESLFPPQCCRQPIPMNTVKSFFTQETVLEFEGKSLEFSTDNRIYCSNPSCGVFVPPNWIKADVATCTRKHKTCAICKGSTHVGRNCPEDRAVKEVLELSKDRGWRQCYHCGHLIELTVGCNHMRQETLPRFTLDRKVEFTDVVVAASAVHIFATIVVLHGRLAVARRPGKSGSSCPEHGRIGSGSARDKLAKYEVVFKRDDFGVERWRGWRQGRMTLKQITVLQYLPQDGEGAIESAGYVCK